jgi:hypothetical protein
MGGDDSQKLLPWRGSYSPSRAQTSGSITEINHITETCSGNLAGRALAIWAMAPASARLGHFWKAHVGQF